MILYAPAWEAPWHRSQDDCLLAYTMAESLGPHDLITLEELAISTMWEHAALVELLERRGVLTRQDVLDMSQELRQREPTAIPPRRLET